MPDTHYLMTSLTRRTNVTYHPAPHIAMSSHVETVTHSTTYMAPHPALAHT